MIYLKDHIEQNLRIFLILVWRKMFEDRQKDTKKYLTALGKMEREHHWKVHFNLKEAFVDIRNNC